MKRIVIIDHFPDVGKMVQIKIDYMAKRTELKLNESEETRAFFNIELMKIKSVFTVTDVAFLTGMSSKEVRELTEKGIIPHSEPLKGTYYYKRKEVEKWMLSNEKQEVRKDFSDFVSIEGDKTKIFF